MVRVWDPVVRVFHWSLAASFAVAWASSENWEGVLLRILWGFVGPRYARFGQFVRRPGTVLDYLGAMGNGSERRYVGHNPAGGAMVVVLLVAMAAAAVGGWLLTTDAFWGSPVMQHGHSLLAHGVLALVVLHLGGVTLASLRHHENLVGAMVVGVKRPAEPGDVA